MKNLQLMLAQQLPRAPFKFSKNSIPEIPIEVGCVLDDDIQMCDFIKFEGFSAFSKLENQKIQDLSQLLPHLENDVVSEETFTNPIIQQAVDEFQELFQEYMAEQKLEEAMAKFEEAVSANKFPEKKKQKTSKGGKCPRDALCIKEKGHRGNCKCKTSSKTDSI